MNNPTAFLPPLSPLPPLPSPPSSLSDLCRPHFPARVPPRSLPCSRRPAKAPHASLPSPDVLTAAPLLVDPFTHPPPRAAGPALPVVIIPGYAADASAYQPMAAALRLARPSTHVSVAPIRSRTWLATLAGRPVTPVLHLIHAAVTRAKAATGAPSVTLVAHSAAGWIARIYLGAAPYPRRAGLAWNGARHVGALVCLGTPHRSAEWVTRANMQFVNDVYPGCFCDAVRYLCLAGDAGSVSGGWREGKWLQRVSYGITDAATRGKPCVGDGIVPLSVAFLDDAERNIRLKGVWHSPASAGPWYGHPRVVDYWSSLLL